MKAEEMGILYELPVEMNEKLLDIIETNIN